MVRLPWHAFRKFDRFERRIRKYLRDVDKYLDKVEKSKRVTKATLKKLRKIFTELLKYLEETEDIILLDMGEIEITKIRVDNKSFLGVRIEMPNAPLLLIKGEKGFAMCGYLNPATAEKLGDAAVIVSGVRTFEDMLNSNIKWVSSKARELGVQEGNVLREEMGKLS